MVDGGQGNRAGREPEGVDPVPPLQQGPAAGLFEWIGAEEKLGVDGPKQVPRGCRSRGGAGRAHHQPSPIVGMLPPGGKGSDGGRGAEGRDRRVIAPGASRAKGSSREFSARCRGRDPVRDFDDGLIEVAEEPVCVGELRDTQEPISEHIPTV